MNFNSTWLTVILLFIGSYYLFLFIESFKVKIKNVLPLNSYFYFLIIPAKNEEKVIEVTVRKCLKLKGTNFRIIVVDDNSTDSTSEIVKGIAEKNDKVILLHNPPNQKKKGKGAVLNFAFNQIKFALSKNFVFPLNLPADFNNRFDYEHIIIGVFDADASPSSNMLEEISKVFSEEMVDAVQTAVRISNRNQSILAKMQDVEFIGFSRIIQKARSHFGSVGLGGNGQFTKLSSLIKIGQEPWGDTLTEDLELGLRLISQGKRLSFTDRAIVEQEGLISLKALIKQRSRWLQGHFMNWMYIPSIIKAKIPLKTKIDSFIYIVFVSVVFLVGFSITASVLSILHIISVSNSMLSIFYNKNFLLGTLALLLYSFVFIPMFIYSVFKFYKENSFLKKMLYIFLFAVYTYIWLPAGIIGLYRLIRKKSEWMKTERVGVVPRSQYKIPSNNFAYERRAAPRYVYHNFSFINGEPCFVENVSETGIKIITIPNKFDKGEIVDINFPNMVEKKARIVWCRTKERIAEMGFEFVAKN
ncbi:MAG: glycosyltransferase [Caldisericaceae bacterium]